MVRGNVPRRRRRPPGSRSGPALLATTVLAVAMVLPVAAQELPVSNPAVVVPVQEGKLTAPDFEAGDRFGWSVTVDGDTLVVGVPEDGRAVGASYVYARTGPQEWSFDVKLVPPSADAVDRVGWSLDLDGDTLAVGAPWKRVDIECGFGRCDEARGAVYVYTNEAPDFEWTVQQRIDAQELVRRGAVAGGPRFGASVDVEDDLLLIGDLVLGHVEAHARDPLGQWSLERRWGGSWFNTERRGAAVALDGDTAAFGAPVDDTQGGRNAGTVRVWARDLNGRWTREAVLTAADGQAFDTLGAAVDVAGDLVVAGAPGADEAGAGAGAVYAFTRLGNLWVQEAKIVSGLAEAGDAFGHAVDLSGDTLLVGAPGTDGERPSEGAAYVFQRVATPDGVEWLEQARLVADDGADFDALGWDVALSAGEVGSLGGTLLGAPGDDTPAGDDTGSAYTFPTVSLPVGDPPS